MVVSYSPSLANSASTQEIVDLIKIDIAEFLLQQLRLLIKNYNHAITLSYLGLFRRTIDLYKLALFMITWFRFDDKRGVTAIEYGLIAALVGLAIIVGVGLIGTNLGVLFNDIGGRLVAPGGGG